MLFEVRQSIPDVSDRWEEVRNLFLEGNSREAWNQAMRRRGMVPLESPNDYLLCIEIARACSANGLYKALVWQGHHRFPDDPLLQLYQSRVLFVRNRYLEAIEFLQERELSLGRTHRAWWGTELASFFGQAGFARSCQHWLKQVQDAPEFDSPLALYSRWSACEGLQQWDTAIELGRKCVAAAPRWSRARGYLAHCLLARGRTDEAIEQLQTVADLGLEEATADVTHAILKMAMGDFLTARTSMEAILARWPQADFRHWVRRSLCLLLVELGDRSAARELIRGFEDKCLIPEITDGSSGAHRCLPMPIIAQNRNQCVPTAVAMAAYPQGRTLDPDALFREMRGREGTQLWRMRTWCENNDFVVVPIRLDQEGICRMIDSGVPLIGVLEGPFNSHVDVICGYHDDLRIYYVRDPGHWGLLAYPNEACLNRYRMYNGLLAVISRSRPDCDQMVDEAHSWHSVETQALLDLSMAVSTGDRQRAEDAYALIGDDSPAAFLREAYAVNVAISPTRFYDRIKAICADDDAPPVARFRAAMMLHSDDSDAVLDLLMEREKDAFSPSSLRFLRLTRAMRQGRWRSASKLIDRLLVHGANIVQLWEMKSDILEELGDREGARSAVEKAIELEPLRTSSRERLLRLDVHRLEHQEFLREFKSLMAQDPDDKRLMLNRIEVLTNSPDGREFENACLEAIEWFPRSPIPYRSLMDWYLFQGRQDLHDLLMEQASAMLPDTFHTDAEKAGPAESDAPHQESADANEQGQAQQTDKDRSVVIDAQGHSGSEAMRHRAEFPVSSSDALPTDPGDLLAMASAADTDTSRAALEKLLRLESAGRLRWEMCARLAALRLLKISQGGSTEEAPEQILPRNPPGAAHWFADLCLDVLTDYPISRPVASAADQWLRTVVPNYRDYPDVWFKRVLLLEQAGEKEEALEELQNLVGKFPAYASGLYRIGVVKYQQQDLVSARRYFERAIAVHPGLFGAVSMLREVLESLGDGSGALKCTHRLRRLFPYNFDFLRDEMLAMVQLGESADAAIESLCEVADDFPKERVRVLRAEILLDAGRYQEADQIVREMPIEDSDPSVFEDLLRVRLRLSLVQERNEEALEICDLGLQRWPDSDVLQGVKADILQQSDPSRARDFLEKILREGEPSPQIVSRFLGLCDSEVSAHAQQIVMKAPPDRQQALAEMFANAMAEENRLQWSEPFLEWAVKQFPDSWELHMRLVYHWNFNGRVHGAVKLAESFLERDPENPEVAECLGRVMVDVDPKRAVEILERAASRDRNVAVLGDMARAYQVLGKTDASCRLHEEILNVNPFVASSWSALVLMSRTYWERYWKLVDPILERGYGVYDEYFLVMVVKVARSLGKTVHENWLPLALRRRVTLDTFKPFLDEKTRLDLALAAWCAVRPGDADDHPHIRSGWIRRMQARLFWPGTKWVPAPIAQDA